MQKYKYKINIHKHTTIKVLAGRCNKGEKWIKKTAGFFKKNSNKYSCWIIDFEKKIKLAESIIIERE